jgi:hypothetical protein
MFILCLFIYKYKKSEFQLFPSKEWIFNYLISNKYLLIIIKLLQWNQSIKKKKWIIIILNYFFINKVKYTDSI